MTTTPPKVSVIMPVFNAANFLAESIDSILRQTLTDFELIIINDGSTDASQDIIDVYAKRDRRIRAFKQENHGVVFTANKAMKEARGRYIARIDADDVALNDRLEQQFSILEENPDTVLVCSSFEVFSDNGEFRYKDIVPPDDIAIKQSLYVRNPIANGSTLIRKSALEEVGFFDDVFAEDLHLWTKLFDKGQFKSTGTILYRWRMNPKGITLTNNGLSQQKGDEYILNLWEKYPPSIVSRKTLRERSKRYIDTYDHIGYTYREIYLTDVSRMASKFVIRHNFIKGLHQLANVALSGRIGFRIALQRIIFIIQGRVPRIDRRVSSSTEVN